MRDSRWRDRDSRYGIQDQRSGIRDSCGCFTLEEVFDTSVDEVAVGKSADGVFAAAGEPANRSLGLHVVAQGRDRHAADEHRAARGVVDGEEARLVLLPREGA